MEEEKEEAQQQQQQQQHWFLPAGLRAMGRMIENPSSLHFVILGKNNKVQKDVSVYVREAGYGHQAIYNHSDIQV